MIIYNRDGSVLADVWLQESSFVNEEIMGDHSAQIDFLSRYPIDLEIGDYIEHEGNIYTLRHNESVTKRETSLGWDYSVVMYSARYELQDVPFFLSDEPQYLKNGDYYTGTASDWLNLIIRNMNREISGWAAGSCVESEWITISFKDKQCSEVLDELCAQLDTEWQVIGRALSIGRVEYPSDGLVLSQGEGGGLKELRLSSSNQERPVTVLYPYGSDKNLPEGYGSDYLLLPGGQKVMERNVDKYGRCGAKKQFDVYPKGEFTVTSVIDDLTFTADGIDFDISSCLIPEQEVTVSFQSGALAGYDLAIAEDGWDNATKQIKVLQNEEENSLKVPGDIHISVGDRFALFNLRMPQAYVDKAEEELKAKADAWLAKKSEKEVRLSAKCDDILFRQCGMRIRCGQMVRILSLELDMDREIRVTKVKRHIENDCPTYRYELTLSDFLDTNGFKQLVKEMENVPEEIKTETKPFKAWTRRSWRDVMETLSMMFDPEGDYFTELIKPLAVHTAQLIVGTNSQQMDLVGVRFIPNKGGDPNIFASTAGRLEHFTISEEGVREWNIAASEYTLNPNTPYYVYAKCTRKGTEGTIICSTDKIKLEDDADYYHFWVGVLNSPYEGSRSWNPNYGYTEIAGQTITTGTIKDKSGQSYFDLTNNKFRMGGQQGSLDWNVTKDDQLTLRGCLYQSPAGDVDYPEVDRGAYSDTVVYYPGDKVSYNGNVYKCIKQTTAGVSPTNETYWKILVYRGSTAFKSTVFKRSNTKPSAPTGGKFDAPVPSEWSDGVPSGEEIIWASTRIFTSDGLSPQQASWTDPQQMTDTADFDVEFSSVASPNPPVNHPNTNAQWSNTADENTIWMATSTKKNGVWSDWTVSKIKGEKGDKGAFKSTVFKRSNTKPSAPTGGSFDKPVPSEWSDGVPSGEEIIWASTRIFTSDGLSPQQASWTDPQQMTDTADFDVEFSSVASPNPPVNHPNTNAQWSNTADENTIWMATSTKKNGVWSDWTVSKIKGEKGDKGAFKSTVFKRSNTKPSAPTGGSFDKPVPSEWSDGVPSGEEIIWASTRIFTSDGLSPQQASWTDPQQMTDTADFDVEFSSVASPNPPVNHPNTNAQWSNTADENTIWMATSTKKNGVWSDWTVSKIKGEKGDKGAFKSTVFKRSNTKPSAPTGGSFDKPVPSEWSDGVPSGEEIIWASTCTFNADGTSSGWSDPAAQSDTATLDIEFSPNETQPSAPSGTTPFANHESEGWYDPSSANFAGKTMIWRAERKVSNGVYNGEWTITRIYGEKGEDSYTYSISPDVKNIALDANGNATPSSYTCTCYRNAQGTRTEETAHWYAYRSNDNINWGDAYDIVENYTASFTVSVSKSYKYYKIVAKPYSNIECYSFAFIVSDGKNGAQGLQGPATPFRGLYDSEKIYYCNEDRTDIVYILDSKGNKVFYIARTDAPAIDMKGKHPVDYPEFWKQFGAQFDNVATDLLLSRKILTSEIKCDNLKALSAKIGGFNIGDTYLNSDSGCYFRTYSGTVGAYIGAQKMILDNVSRDISVSGTGAFFSSAYINDLYVFGDVKRNLSIGNSSDQGYYGLTLHNSNNTFTWFIRTDRGLYLSQNGQVDTHGASFQFVAGTYGGVTYKNTDNGAPCNIWCRGKMTDSSNTSDDRLKQRDGNLSDVLDSLEKMNCFRFHFKRTYDDHQRIGMSAQEIMAIYPEIVSTFNNPDDKEEYYNIEVYGLTTLAIQACKELHAKVKALEDRVKTLEG